jgi:hypothetical protein
MPATIIQRMSATRRNIANHSSSSSMSATRRNIENHSSSSSAPPKKRRLEENKVFDSCPPLHVKNTLVTEQKLLFLSGIEKKINAIGEGIAEIQVFQHNLNIRIGVVQDRSDTIQSLLDQPLQNSRDIHFSAQQIMNSNNIFRLHGVDPTLLEEQLQLNRFGHVVEAFSLCVICLRHFREHVLDGRNKDERILRWNNLTKSVLSVESKVGSLLQDKWDMMDVFLKSIKPRVVSLKNSLTLNPWDL